MKKFALGGVKARGLLLRTTALLLGGCVASAAAAEDAAAPAGFAGLEEIVVTAQKRAGNIQDTPVAITALTGDALERLGMGSLSDISKQAPGLTFTTIGLRSPFLFMRGIGTGSFDIGSDPSIAVFIDDLYLPRFTALQVSLEDIERVEVLKGPQGALFGRNTEGGAISIITSRPTDHLTAKATLEAGNKKYLAFRGSISGPLVADKLLARVSVSGQRRDGWVENTVSGVDALGLKGYSGRGQLEYRGEDINLLLTASYGRDKPTAATFSNVTKNVFLMSPASPLFGHVPSSFDPEKQAYDTDGFQRRTEYLLSGKIDWDIGFATLTSITGYLKHEFQELHDLDGTEAFVLNRYADEGSKTFSQELRLTSDKTGAFDWIIGGFYYKDKAHRLDQWQLGRDSGISRTFAGQQTVIINDNLAVETESYAIFGQLGYDITDQLRLQLGARYTSDKKDADRATSRNISTPLLFNPYTLATGKKWHAFDPQASLQYKPNDDVMVYVSYSEGFKSGGFQPAVAGNASIAGAIFDPEGVQSYEAGVKSMFFDNRLRLNIAAFHVKYKNLQFLSANGEVSPGVPLIVVTNAASSQTDGVEIEMQAAITENFQLSGGYSYLDAKFKKYIDGSGVNHSGNQMIRTPKHQVFGSANYSIPLAVGRINVMGDINYRSRLFFNPENTVSVSQKGYTLWGGRIEYALDEQNWKVALWGKNLGNNKHCGNILVAANSTVGLCSVEEFRSYGLTFSYALN
ncbi:TonB-dependent receptor [Govanella unica]|uniref:TonB-dependent receptor n=1 Tax=Govanella unica TaxID=2975056 RepID=A0A9X3TXY6_9PROT|nr:TonB-dependent receptor [Govania unica]MDA5194046.1 TonB-dependent receptor [Govania unica]